MRPKPLIPTFKPNPPSTVLRYSRSLARSQLAAGSAAARSLPRRNGGHGVRPGPQTTLSIGRPSIAWGSAPGGDKGQGLTLLTGACPRPGPHRGCVPRGAARTPQAVLNCREFPRHGADGPRWPAPAPLPRDTPPPLALLSGRAVSATPATPLEGRGTCLPTRQRTVAVRGQQRVAQTQAGPGIIVRTPRPAAGPSVAQAEHRRPWPWASAPAAPTRGPLTGGRSFGEAAVWHHRCRRDYPWPRPTPQPEWRSRGGRHRRAQRPERRELP